MGGPGSLGSTGTPGTPGYVGPGSTGGGPASAPISYGIGVEAARRLTPTEFDATVFSLVGDTQSNSTATLPAALKNPFDNDYTLQEPSQALIEGAEALATDIATRLVADTTRRNQLVGCTPASANDTACFRQFLSAFGRRVTRHPMSSAELDKFTTTLMPYAVAADDFYVAVQLAVQALLQDMRLIYRLECPHATPQLDGSEARDPALVFPVGHHASDWPGCSIRPTLTRSTPRPASRPPRSPCSPTRAPPHRSSASTRSGSATTPRPSILRSRSPCAPSLTPS